MICFDCNSFCEIRYFPARLILIFNTLFLIKRPRRPAGLQSTEYDGKWDDWWRDGPPGVRPGTGLLSSPAGEDADRERNGWPASSSNAAASGSDETGRH